MLTRMILIVALVVALFAAIACQTKEPPPPARQSAQLDTLVDWMSGQFSNEEQAVTDSRYHNVILVMAPIWDGRTDGHWLYVEQAAADKPDMPFGQRVHQVLQLDDSSFTNEVYAFTEMRPRPGSWRVPMVFDSLSPDDLTLQEGCGIVLSRDSTGAFVGSTIDNTCEAQLMNADYLTSEVRITENSLYSWDRGWDSTGHQVWGTKSGGYLFKKVYEDKEPDLKN